jgi:CubicO group peptidase (beta-lactamase class C family)
MSAGLTPEGIEALDAALTRHVAQGSVPGLVALVASGDDVHVAAPGHKAFGDAEPIGRDAIFRIASITKPIAGVAAMLLIEDGAMALDDPVGQWLPELAEPRVLRTLESSLDDTVPAERPITVQDVLSFHMGFGSIMSRGPYPIWQAESDLGLKTLGPPWPPPDLTPDEWIARLGQLPLLDQPGTRWRYNTGATVAGVLIERVAGAPLADVMRERVFEPLGMADTGFWVPAGKMGRFTTFYAPDPDDGELQVIDRPGGWWSAPPKLPDAAGSLVSTVDDLWAFAAMLASGGGDLLSAESVRLMTADRMTAQERADNRVFVGDHGGWGLMMAVPSAAGPGGPGGPASSDASASIPGGYGWEGGSGTTWRTDTAAGLTGILLTQRQVTSPEPTEIAMDFWTAAYAAAGS